MNARRRLRLLLAVVAALLLAAVIANLLKTRAPYPRPLHRAAAAACTTHWVGSWAASPSGDSVTQSLADQTVRMIVAPHLGGRTLRVHLTNRYGAGPVRLGPVTIGVAGLGASLRSGSERAVSFGGQSTIVIPAGGDAVSDPVKLRFGAFEDLAVSVFVPGAVTHPDEHLITRQTSYLSPRGSGDAGASIGGAAFTRTTTARLSSGRFSTGWYFLDGVDVLAPGSTGAVVAFGDSLTDGYQPVGSRGAEDLADLNANERYTDFLQRRLTAAQIPLSVLNAGVSGDQLLHSGLPTYGQAGLVRFAPDVLDQAGVTDVIVLIGLNDIAVGATARELIAGYKLLIDRAHAAGVAIQLGTLTPTGGALEPAYASAAAVGVREAVNHWIRTQRYSDGIVDFDAAVRDAENPGALTPADAGSDDLHLSPAGNRVLAGAVDLGRLARPDCVGD